MKEAVYLTPITEPYIFCNVELGTGKVMESLYLNPGEAWFDQNGTIRTFSIKFDNGTVDNYFLLPKDNSKEALLSILNSGLAEFGLKLIGETIFQGSSVILNLGSFLFSKHGNNYLKEYLGEQTDANLGYIEVASREVVFNRKMNIKAGFPISSISYFIVNQAEIPLKYQISKDKVNWNHLELPSGGNTSHYFVTGQKKGFIRVFTNNRGYQEYSIYAPNTYTLDWNDEKECWDVFYRK